VSYISTERDFRVRIFISFQFSELFRGLKAGCSGLLITHRRTCS